MKKLALLLFALIGFMARGLAQPVSVPESFGAKDTTKYYYLSTCEEYQSMIRHHHWYNKPDTCTIDFSKYDLAGTRENDKIRWELVYPKKYTELKYQKIYSFDKTDWKVFPRDIIIEHDSTYSKLRKKTDATLPDSFDFNTQALICNNVWVDCRGSFYFKILYDPIENKIVCHLIEVYGGSRAMCPRFSWILIDKPCPDTKIVMKEYWIK